MKDKIEQYVGIKFKIKVNTMLINVVCIDYKVSYGKERWLVEPVEGTGQMWVQEILPLETINNS